MNKLSLARILLVVLMIAGGSMVPADRVMGAGAVTMQADVNAFGPHSMYLAVWNYAVPTISDAMDKAPLFRLSVTNGLDRDVCAKYRLDASYDGRGYGGGIGTASGFAVFEPVLVPAGSTVHYEINTKNLSFIDQVLPDLQNKDLDINQLREKYKDQLGPFATWNVIDSGSSSDVNANDLWPVLARMDFPGGRYVLSIESWYQDAGPNGTCSATTGSWNYLEKESYTWEISKIGNVKAVYPLAMHGDLLSPTQPFNFIWSNPLLPVHVQRVDVQLVLKHGSKTIWTFRKEIPAGELSNKEYAVLFDPAKAAEELVGGETYTWRVSLSDPANIPFGITGREFAAAEESFTLSNTQPRVSISPPVKDGLSYTFSGEIRDTEDEKLRQLGYNTTRAQYCWSVAQGGSVKQSVCDTKPEVAESFTFKPSARGVYTVTLSARDQHGAVADPDVYYIDNKLPTVSLSGPVEVQLVDRAFTVSASIYDEDNDDLTLIWRVDNKIVATQAGVGGRDTVEKEFTLTTTGTHTISVEVSDGLPGTQSASFSVQVEEMAVNRTPEIQAPAALTVKDIPGLTCFDLPLMVIDDQDEDLTVGVALLSAGGSGVLASWEAEVAPNSSTTLSFCHSPALAAGEYQVRITTADKERAAAVPVLVKVTVSAEPPVLPPTAYTLSIVRPAAGTSVMVGSEVTVEAAVEPALPEDGELRFFIGTVELEQADSKTSRPHIVSTADTRSGLLLVRVEAWSKGVKVAEAVRQLSVIPVKLNFLQPAEGEYEIFDILTLEAELTGAPSEAVVSFYKDNNLLGNAYTVSRADVVKGMITFKAQAELDGMVLAAATKTVLVKRPQVTLTLSPAGTAFTAGDEVYLSAVLTGAPAAGGIGLRFYAGTLAIPVTEDGRYKYTFNKADGITGQVTLRARLVTEADGLTLAQDDLVVKVAPNRAPEVQQLSVSPAAEGLTYELTEVQSAIPLTFTAVAVDPDGDALEWSWTIAKDDAVVFETAAEDSVLAYTFDSPGLYEVQVTATDAAIRGEAAAAGSRSLRLMITRQVVGVVNTAPVLEIEPPAKNTYLAGERINVNARVSDADGDQIHVTWSLVDERGGESLILDTVAAVDCPDRQGACAPLEARLPQVKEATTYSLKAVANDMRGGSASAQLSIVVNPVVAVIPPQPVITAPEKITAGVPAVFTAGLAQSEQQGTVSFIWSAAKAGGDTYAGTGETFEVTFRQSGLHTVKLEAVNDLGGVGEATLNVAVAANQPPFLELLDGQGNSFPNPMTVTVKPGENSPVINVYAVFTDPDNSDSWDDLRRPVKWQVNPEAPFTVDTTDGADGNREVLAFGPAAPGAYLITAIIEDSLGQLTGDVKTIVIAQEQPVTDDREDDREEEGPRPPAKANVAPAVSILSTALQVTADQPTWFEAMVSDGEAGSLTLLWLVDGVPVPGSQASINLETAAGSGTGDAGGDGEDERPYRGVGRASITLKPGVYSLTARVIDAAGAQGEDTKEGVEAVTVTGVVATGKILRPLPNTKVFAGGRVDFTAMVSPLDADVQWVITDSATGVQSELSRDLSFGIDAGVPPLTVGLHEVELLVEGQSVGAPVSIEVWEAVETRARVASIYGIDREVKARLVRLDGTVQELAVGDGVLYNLYEGDEVIVDYAPRVVSRHLVIWPVVGKPIRLGTGGSYKAVLE
ncbi:MAG TPA: PKD domain-containing protein [Firmicutes bacterium]|nr:PKD domain-containing protein [Bacillota bacterium]